MLALINTLHVCVVKRRARSCINKYMFVSVLEGETKCLHKRILRLCMCGGRGVRVLALINTTCVCRKGRASVNTMYMCAKMRFFDCTNLFRKGTGPHYMTMCVWGY